MKSQNATTKHKVTETERNAQQEIWEFIGVILKQWPLFTHSYCKPADIGLYRNFLAPLSAVFKTKLKHLFDISETLTIGLILSVSSLVRGRNTDNSTNLSFLHGSICGLPS